MNRNDAPQTVAMMKKSIGQGYGACGAASREDMKNFGKKENRVHACMRHARDSTANHV